MRLLLVILVSLYSLSPMAQTYSPINGFGFTSMGALPVYKQLNDTTGINPKWYFSKYAGFSAGFGFYNGGSTTVFSAPVGLQLNHPLNNNLIAFAGISAVPAFFSFSRTFTDPGLNKNYPGIYRTNTYGFDMNTRVEMGLMYVNDARTFSISGSIGIERSSYPDYPPPGHPNTKKQLSAR